MTRNGTHPQRKRDEPAGAGADAFARLYERPLPFSLEAEMGLLGSIIIGPQILGDVQPIMAGALNAFYDERHAAIYQALIDTFDRKPDADLIDVVQVLRDRGQDDDGRVGEYLMQLAEQTPSPLGGPRYARMVADLHRRRKLIEVCDQTIHETLHASSLDDGAELIDKAEARVFGLRGDEAGANAPTSLGDLLDLELARMRDADGAEAGTKTGFYDLDKITSGLHPGEMVVLAARPSMGKTALMLNLAEQVARGGRTPDQHHAGEPAPIGIFSLEMSKAALVQRMLSAHAGVDSQRIREGKMGAADMATVEASSRALHETPILIDDSSNLNLLTLRSSARRMVAQHGATLIMIDYLQLLSAPGMARGDGRQVEVSAVSRGIKALAKELKIPVVVLSQLNRASENRQGNRPRMSDLRESGSIEQDADVVLLLHREDYYHREDQDWRDANPDKVNVAELIVEKQRNGPTGVVHLHWDPRTTRFRNHAAYAGTGGYSAPAAAVQGSLIDDGRNW